MASKKKSKKPAAKSSPKKAKSAKKAPAKRRAPAAKPGWKLESVAPGITANDLEKSLGWYRDVVGFAVEETWTHEGKVAGAQLRAGNVVVLLGQDDWKKGRDRKKGEGFRLYWMATGDIDAMAKGIVARGGTLDQPPTDQPWGMRDFSLTDPDGFKITVAKVTKKR
ncbi:MAG TPA: VOC family protein [Thermoanaerobaculia bacterium]|nr:VOC family protein [Thermoanaerobaculia bacterium]